MDCRIRPSIKLRAHTCTCLRPAAGLVPTIVCDVGCACGVSAVPFVSVEHMCRKACTGRPRVSSKKYIEISSGFFYAAQKYVY